VAVAITTGHDTGRYRLSGHRASLVVTILMRETASPFRFTPAGKGAED
jgi:hypothetical protein